MTGCGNATRCSPRCVNRRFDAQWNYTSPSPGCGRAAPVHWTVLDIPRAPWSIYGGLAAGVRLAGTCYACPRAHRHPWPNRPCGFH